MLSYRTKRGSVENKTGVVQVCYFYFCRSQVSIILETQEALQFTLKF